MSGRHEPTSAWTIISPSAERTRNLGRVLGGLLAEGDIVLLAGNLGAGKTQLTKGIAEAFGIREEITSPTFALQMSYEGEAPDGSGEPITLHHFDLYRIDDENRLEDTGIYDVLGEDGVCVVEWGERFESITSLDGVLRIDILRGGEDGPVLDLGRGPGVLELDEDARAIYIECKTDTEPLLEELERRL